MSTPEPRFEVPPEYAEVYERAYRRAYEEVQASLAGSSGLDTDAEDADVPLQRSGRRPLVGTGHRAERSRRSIWVLLGVAALVVVGLVVTFMAGRQSAAPPTPDPSAGARAERTIGSFYNGESSPARVRTVSTTCTALPGAGPDGRTVDYEVENVLDQDGSTAWSCDRLAVGQVLTFTLAPGSRVVQVGLVPGYASGTPGSADDLYARDNRITRVEWVLGPGKDDRVAQELSPDPDNRALRVTNVTPIATQQVQLRILAVTRGAHNATAISTVQILTSP